MKKLHLTLLKIVERKNRSLTELVDAILLDSGAAPSCWGEIIKTVSYVFN